MLSRIPFRSAVASIKRVVFSDSACIDTEAVRLNAIMPQEHIQVDRRHKAIRWSLLVLSFQTIFGRSSCHRGFIHMCVRRQQNDRLAVWIR